ncbi:MAG: RodZ domain-containing protein [Polaromonas sp.]
MSEADTSTMSQDSSPAELQGAGALLKQAREASGLHIAALAVLLKVPVKKLEALESDRLDLLPDAVFVRALASSVCRTLKIDPTVILARLPQTHAPKLIYQGTGINEPFRSPGDGPGPSIWSQVSRPAVLAGLLLLMGALVLILLPVIKTGIGDIRPELSESRAKNMETENAIPAVVAVDTSISDSQKASVSQVTSQATSVITSPVEPASASAAPGVVAGVPLAAKTSVTVTVSSPLPTSQSKVLSAGTSSPTFVVTANAPSASDVVVFTAKTESWVEAIDARGQVVLRRTLAAGEVVGAAGALPLKVVVGRANATLVEIRGKAFDLNAVAKDNVARFEVK